MKTTQTLGKSNTRLDFLLKGMRVVLVLGALLSTAKLFILGLTNDEEYAVTMAYRSLAGDSMFLTMWDPHQISGYACAALIRIFLLLTGSTTCLVLFLRVCGACISAGIALFVYFTIKRYYAEVPAFFCGILSYILLPKWTLVPEFSNLQLWCTLGLSMCLLRLLLEKKASAVYGILGGLFLCGSVLAYPTALLLFPVVLILLWRGASEKKTGPRNAAFFALPCLLVGGLYLGYFLLKLSPSGFLYGLGQMLSDGAHSATPAEKLLDLLREAAGWLPVLAAISALGLFVCYLLKSKEPILFGSLLLSFSLIHQFIVWQAPEPFYLLRPMLFFYLACLLSALSLPKAPAGKALLQAMVIPSACIFFCVLLMTNTGLRATGVFLLPGILPLFPGLWLRNERGELGKAARIAAASACLLLLFVLYYERGFLVYENQGYKADALFVKQKALSGPAKNIYCRYLDGYDYNNAAEILAPYGDGSEVLLVAGDHSLWYLLGDFTIGNYSTISTPTFDERLLTYWGRFPDHRPTLVLGHKSSADLAAVLKLLPGAEFLEERNDLVLYRVK